MSGHGAVRLCRHGGRNSGRHYIWSNIGARSDFASPGPLLACAVTDVLRNGLSMVYSFYHPGEISRSLGTHMILDHIDEATRRGLSYVYLGYWIEGSDEDAV